MELIVNSLMGPLETPSKAVTLEELTADSPPPSIAHAKELLLEYGRFVIAQPNTARFCFGALEKEVERLPFSFIGQGGGCLMARAGGDPAGFVAWRDLPPETAPDAWELKRLWVRPEARGLGLGRTLTQAVLDRAVTAGRKSIWLDTQPEAMATAHRLYLELGFTPCTQYNDNPVEGLAYLVKFL